MGAQVSYYIGKIKSNDEQLTSIVLMGLPLNNEDIAELMTALQENTEAARRIQEIIIIDCKFEEINLPTNLTNLKNLSLDFNNIRNMPRLAHLVALKSLTILGNKLTSFAAEDSFPDLNRLAIGGYEFASFEFSEKLASLEYLYINANISNKIDIPGYLKNLQELCITGSLIKTVRISDQLKNLSTISVNDTQVTSLDISENLENLQGIDLERNRISVFNVKEKWAKLKRLSIKDNRLKFFIMPRIKSIETLCLQHNNLTMLHISQECINLSSVQVGHNKFSTISLPPVFNNNFALEITNNPLTKAIKIALVARFGLNVEMTDRPEDQAPEVNIQLTQEHLLQHFEILLNTAKKNTHFNVRQSMCNVAARILPTEFCRLISDCYYGDNSELELNNFRPFFPVQVDELIKNKKFEEINNQLALYLSEKAIKNADALKKSFEWIDNYNQLKQSARNSLLMYSSFCENIFMSRLSDPTMIEPDKKHLRSCHLQGN